VVDARWTRTKENETVREPSVTKRLLREQIVRHPLDERGRGWSEAIGVRAFLRLPGPERDIDGKHSQQRDGATVLVRIDGSAGVVRHWGTRLQVLQQFALLVLGQTTFSGVELRLPR
jgi:hypothetical protein